MAHPEPFYSVVLLFSIKTIAVIISMIIARAVTIQITNLGRNIDSTITMMLNPTDMRTPHIKYSMAFCEFHRS